MSDFSKQKNSFLLNKAASFQSDKHAKRKHRQRFLLFLRGDKIASPITLHQTWQGQPCTAQTDFFLTTAL
jgi:hypothetical protein